MSTAATDECYLTAREAAALLAVTEFTVRRWVNQDKLPAKRLPGGGLRFRKADIDGLLTEAN